MLVYFQYWYCFTRKVVKITYVLRWAISVKAIIALISVEVHKVCAIFWSPHWPNSTFHSSVPGLIQNSCLHQIQEFQSSKIEDFLLKIVYISLTSILHNFESHFQVLINSLIQFIHSIKKASKFEKIMSFRFFRHEFLIRFKIRVGCYVLVNLVTSSVIILHYHNSNLGGNSSMFVKSKVDDWLKFLWPS